MGELLASLCLADSRECLECACLLVRQCVEIMSQSLYDYAGERGSSSNLAPLPRGVELHGAIKEQAINSVVSGKFNTLEDALADKGYRRNLAGNIFKEQLTQTVVKSNPSKLPVLMPPTLVCCGIPQLFNHVLCCLVGSLAGLPERPFVPQPVGVQRCQVPTGLCFTEHSRATLLS